MTTAHDGSKVVSLTHLPPLPPGNTPGTHFCQRLSRSATWRFRSLKNSSDTIGNRNRDLPVCSVVAHMLVWHNIPLAKLKKIHPTIGHAGLEGENMYSSNLSLTSAFDGGRWSTQRPGRFMPGNDLVPLVLNQMSGICGVDKIYLSIRTAFSFLFLD